MSEWETVSIAQLGRVVTGKTPPTASAEYFGGDELFVSPRDLSRNSYYVAETETRITSKALEKFKNQVIPRNSIIFTSLSFAFGKMGIAQRSLLTNQQINSVIVNSDNNYKFVFYLLKVYEDIIFSYNSGIDTPIVPKSVFEKIKVRIPQKKIQVKIAGILSAYDDLIENNRRRIALLERMAEQLYREWFVRFRFPGYQHAKFEKGVPSGWRVAKLSELAYVNASSIKKGCEPVSIRYLDIGAVTTNAVEIPAPINYSDAPGRARRRVRHGDVIWSSVRPANRAYGLILEPPENLIASTGFAVISNHPDVPFSFIKYAITTDTFVEQMTAVAKGAAYPATSFDDFENASLLLPISDVLVEFDRLVLPMLTTAHCLARQNEVLKATRDLLLPRLISGKLRVDQLDIQFPPSMQAESA